MSDKGTRGDKQGRGSGTGKAVAGVAVIAAIVAFFSVNGGQNILSGGGSGSQDQNQSEAQEPVAAEEDIQATLDFLEWVVTSEEGTDALANKMNFVCPFKKAKEADNYLVKLANEMVAAGKTPVSWNFPTMPSEQWKDDLGFALIAYAADQTDAKWNDVKTAFVDGWAKEYAAKK